MSFFEDASLVLIPSAQKLSKIYSIKPTDGSGDLAFTRSNDTATRVASNGLIERVRTNLTLNSQTGASWVASGSTIDSTTTADPLGGTDAVQFTALGGEDSQVFSDNTISFSSGQIFTGSVYVKNVDADFAQLTFSPGTRFTSGQRQNFDLTNGTLADGSGLLGSSIEDVGGGWYRISISATTTNSTTAGSIVLSIAPSGSAARLDDSTAGQTLIAFGFQFESGDIMTDYIATTTAAVSVGPVANVPRLDYLGSSCPRLLLEPQRTNLVPNSEQFDNATWSNNGILVANQGVSPDGYTNADLFYSTTGTGKRIFDAVTITSATIYTSSVFAKASGKSFIFFSDVDNITNSVWFNLSNGTFSTPVEGTATMVDYGNGWYRCSLTTTSTTTTGYSYVGISDASGSITFTQNGTDGVLIWGAQLEAGAYATSYIPTLSAAVTRGQDQAEKASISSLIGATEGTMFVDILFTGAADNNPAYIQTWASQTERLGLFYSSPTNLIRPYLVSSGQTDFSLGFTPTAGTRYKMAFCYKANDYAFFVNGSQVTIDTKAAVPTAGTKLFVGCLDSATQANRQFSNINQALLFKTRLSNADLAALTA